MKHLTLLWRRHASLVCATAIAVSVPAQMYVNKKWVQTTGAPDNIDWTASTFDALGNVIVVGNTLVSPGNPDVLITKYDSEGALLWQQTFAGSANAQDYGVAVVADGAGNCFVAATVTNTNSSLDIAVLKYDTNGALVWSAMWNGPTNLMDAPSCIAIDASGNVYAAGSTLNTMTNPDYAIVKWNASGVLQWSATYNYAGFADVATGIEFDQLSDPIITGGSATAINAWDYATVRYNKVSGAQTGVNRVSIPGVGLDNALAIARDNAGSLFITGYRETGGNKDIQTVKLTSTFGLAWVQNYTGQGLEDVGKAVGGDNLGNVYITGHTRKTNGGSDFITIKYGPTGTVLWERRYQARNDSWIAEANKLAVTDDGGVIVTGTIHDGTSTNFMTVKYTEFGKLEWAKEYDGLNGDDKSSSLLADATGNVYVSGLTATGTGAEYATVKYSSFKKDHGIVYDSIGDPFCVANELIVKFRPSVVNTAVVDDQEWEYGDLETVIGDSLTARIETALGLTPNPGGKGLQAFKIFQRLTTADSVSLTRLGEHIPFPPFWATFLVTMPDPIDLLTAKDALDSLSGFVRCAELNGLARPDYFPNDAHWSPQLGLRPNFYANSDINASVAWDTQVGSDQIKVGVVDFPVKWAHPDFGDGTYAGSKIHGGWDYVSNVHISNMVPAGPNSSHGTACAGIIGALRNNSIGVAGIAGGDVDNDGNPGCPLYSFGIFNNEQINWQWVFDVAPVSSIGAAIVEASGETFGGTFGYGVHVLNNSWGLEYPSGFLMDAVQFAYANQCVVVASRGNDGNTGDAQGPNFPATAAREDWVLSVGGSTTDGSRVYFSSSGANMDFTAPAVEQLVYTTGGPFNGMSYNATDQCTQFNGTSAAAPHVSGVAALMLSEHNTLNGADNDLAPEDVEEVLQRTATDVVETGLFPDPVGYGIFNGWGKINAGLAVHQVHGPEYRVYHSDAPSTVSQVTFPNQMISFGSQFDLPPNIGIVWAERTEVSHTYTLSFPSNTEIIGAWPRGSSVTGIDPSTGPQPIPWQSCSFAVNGNAASVTCTTNCWYVIENTWGVPVNQWVPAPPTQLATAFSLHLHDGTEVGIDDIRPSGILIYPSPAEDFLFVELNETGAGLISCEVLDALGREVAHHDMAKGVTGPIALALAIHCLSAGTYSLRCLWRDHTRTFRFQKS